MTEPKAIKNSANQSVSTVIIGILLVFLVITILVHRFVRTVTEPNLSVCLSCVACERVQSAIAFLHGLLVST